MEPNRSRPTELSAHDNDVLSRIFSPHLPSAALDQAIHEQTSAEFEIELEQNDPELLSKVKQLEIKGVEAAEGGNFTLAEEFFTQAIELMPERASGYNNRAQCFRLAHKLSEAEVDLEKAIELSNGNGAVARQAFTQRGIIRNYRGCTGDEQGALCDFRHAASLGSEFAKSQLVAMNPYAAMCSAMMSEMITKIRRGEAEG